ncbi:MAG: PP2C family protein-serine/threonine phosphatase [Acidimicrobiales bacterium]
MGWWQLPRSLDQPHGDPALALPRQRAADTRRLQQVGNALAWVVMGVGLLVLVGYAVDNDRIVELSPSLPPMYPNTAIGLALGGAAALAAGRQGASRWIGAACAAGLTAVGAVELSLNLVQAGPTWVEGLFRPGVVAATTPVGGRPVVETCAAFVLVGGALLLITLDRKPLVAQGLALGSAMVGASAVAGFALGVDRRELGSTVAVGMALHTGLGIALLGSAAVLIRPAVGVLGRLLEGGVTGGLVRRLTLVIAGTPLMLTVVAAGLARLTSDNDMALSVFSVVQMAALGALVLVPSAVIVRTEWELRERLDNVQRRAESADDLTAVVEAITTELSVTRPEIPGWETGMRYEPAHGHLTGDSVQVLRRQLPAPATLLAVFDIAGHGAQSAVLAYGLRTHIAALWENGAGVAEIAASANAKLLRRRTNATAVLVEMPDDDGDVRLVNAGHPPPLQVKGRKLTHWRRTGPLLGFPGVTHEVRSIPVAPGELLVITTDGLHEARTEGRTLLGEERLAELIAERHDDAPQRLADACVDLALEHTGGRLRDDALVVVARRC